jgi:hypothetical protein
MEKRKQALDHEPDRGLADTFPGSDPVAIAPPPRSSRDKRKRLPGHELGCYGGTALIHQHFRWRWDEEGVTRGRKIIEYILRQISPGTR